MARTGVTFVIMAGGRGERLWPLVRAATPKVCLSPDGTRSLIQVTIDRLRPVWPAAEWLVVTTRGQDAPIRRVLSQPSSVRIIVEPEGKNTAACITLAAVAVAAQDPQRIMVAVPADHWMGDVPAFQRTMRAAIRAAIAHDTIVTIGIPPRSPHPGLGYLRAGASVNHAPAGAHLFRLARFVEKPSPRAAERLLRQPGTYWNSGMFIGRADTFLASVTEWLPDHSRRLVPLAGVLSRSGASRLPRRLASAYRPLANVSFDRGVMQHLANGLVVEGRFGWEDLGSWDVWARLGRSNPRRVLLDSQNVCVVGQPDHLVAAIGVRDLLVVQTPTATLICRPDRAQEVRAVVKRLAAAPRLAAYL